MFGWFTRRKPEPLVFSDSLEAFSYACGQSENRLLVNAVLPALVVEQGRMGEEGERYFLLRLATDTGEKKIWACTLKEATDFPGIGDFVGFRVVKIASDLPEDVNLIGYVAFKLLPEYVKSKGWRISSSYTPPDIKPELHM
ncbi:MAG TPA: hypothetical protein VI389_02900 [Geobacteraceae bacterium]